MTSVRRRLSTTPYDVSAGLAQHLLADDSSITLTLAQDAVFNQAKTMTDDHRWCCCQCWRWYMSEGLAKVLITTYHMNAAAIAHVVDLTNGCGGALLLPTVYHFLLTRVGSLHMMLSATSSRPFYFPLVMVLVAVGMQ